MATLDEVNSKIETVISLKIETVISPKKDPAPPLKKSAELPYAGIVNDVIVNIEKQSSKPNYRLCESVKSLNTLEAKVDEIVEPFARITSIRKVIEETDVTVLAVYLKRILRVVRKMKIKQK